MTADNFIVSGGVVEVQVDTPVVETVLVRGPQGPPGDPGPAYEGVAWWFGDGPPEGIVGAKPGDWYLNTADGTIFRLGD